MATIRVGAGRSSKKVGKSVQITSSSSNSNKSGGSSTRLPPIPHQETPSWQKPITNFFKLNNQSGLDKREQEAKLEEEEESSAKKLRLSDGKPLEQTEEENYENLPQNIREADEKASTPKE